MMFTAARSLLLSCLVLTACGGEPPASNPGTPDPLPPAPPPPPAATSVSFSCAGGPLVLDLPCQVGVPLGGGPTGVANAVECTAHVAGKTGIVTMVFDMSTPANRVTEIPKAGAPTFGDIREFKLLRSSVIFSQIDMARRTFVGRLENVAVYVDGAGNCELPWGPISGVAGNFM